MSEKKNLIDEWLDGCEYKGYPIKEWIEYSKDPLFVKENWIDCSKELLFKIWQKKLKKFNIILKVYRETNEDETDFKCFFNEKEIYFSHVNKELIGVIIGYIFIMIKYVKTGE